MELSIIIPAYNEAYGIVRTIRALNSIKDMLPESEIIVVDDGSTDGTAELAQLEGVNVVISHPSNQGYGNAIRTGFNEAQGKIIVTYDADGEYDPESIIELIQPIIDGSTDLVIGSRLKGQIKQGARTYPSKLGVKLFTRLINLLYGTNFTDSLSSLRAYRSKAIRNVTFEENGFSCLVEILIKFKKSKYSVIEIPVVYRARTGVSNLNPLRGAISVLMKIISLRLPKFLRGY